MNERNPIQADAGKPTTPPYDPLNFIAGASDVQAKLLAAICFRLDMLLVIAVLGIAMAAFWMFVLR